MCPPPHLVPFSTNPTDCTNHVCRNHLDGDGKDITSHGTNLKFKNGHFECHFEIVKLTTMFNGSYAGFSNTV